MIFFFTKNEVIFSSYRTNAWLHASIGNFLPHDEQARCEHKASQDFAKVEISLDLSRDVEVSVLDRRTSGVQQLVDTGTWVIS